eukprot:6489659-Amphidinium_carterae.3
MVNVSNCTSAGSLVQAALLAWNSTSGVIWELRRFLEPAGFKETKALPLKEHVRRNFAAWQAYMVFLGLPNTSAVRSGKSLVARGEAANAGGEVNQEHQLSTAGMLALLCHWCHYRKAHDHKELARALLKGVLTHVLPPDDLEPLLDANPQMPATDAPCVHALPGGEGCSCWKSVLDALAELTEQDSPQLLFANMILLGAEPARKHCAVVRVWLLHLLTDAATCIDASYGKWGVGDWQKSAAASVQGKRKQRRVSVQLKEWVTDSVATRRFMSGEEAIHALDSTSSAAYRNWRAADLCSLRLMMHESMHRCRNLSIAIDATRLGRPAQEWLFGVATQLDESMHCSLPPQVMCLDVVHLRANTVIRV